MHKLQVPQTLGEIPPPPSTAGEDVATSGLDEIHVDWWLPLLPTSVSISSWYLNLLLDIPRLDRVPLIFLMENSARTS